MLVKVIVSTATLTAALLAAHSAWAGMSSAMIQHCTPASGGKPPVCIFRNVAVDINQNKRFHM